MSRSRRRTRQRRPRDIKRAVLVRRCSDDAVRVQIPFEWGGHVLTSHDARILGRRLVEFADWMDADTDG